MDTPLVPNTIALDAINPMINHEDYYRATVGVGPPKVPNPLVLEVGQPPSRGGQLCISRGDILILLAGSDDPNGSDNVRGVLGLSIVEELSLQGSGKTARCAIRSRPILLLDRILDNDTILNSPFRAESRIDDIGVFGLEKSPQTHNCTRFFLLQDAPEVQEQRVVGLLGLLTEVDTHIKEKLAASDSWLADLVPDAPPRNSIQVAATPHAAAPHSGVAPLRQPQISFMLAVALCTKPFVILTGPSGTGKSKLAVELAVALDYGPSLPGHLASSRVNPATCSAFVPVGADWTDQRDLLGYPNPFGPRRAGSDGETNQTYEVTDTLKLMLRAMHPDAIDRPHFLILDEMNLSHVERYFSSFLSLMEANRSSSGSESFELLSQSTLNLVREVLTHQGSHPMEVEAATALIDANRGLPFPPNLHVIGTVNVDETTYMFSPKVLDRAFVIELPSVKPSAYLAASPPASALIPADKALRLFQQGISWRVDRSWERKKPIELLTEVVGTVGLGNAASDDLRKALTDVLDGVYKLLSPVGFGFGYRAVNEIVQYLAVWLSARRLLAGDAAPLRAHWRIALDAAIHMKLLPKLHGNRRQLGDSLQALSAFFDGHAAPDASYNLGSGLTVQISASERLSFRLKASSAKCRQLDQRLRSGGYATFIS